MVVPPLEQTLFIKVSKEEGEFIINLHEDMIDSPHISLASS